MQRAALYIQSTWRMARCRRAFLAARAAATAVQAQWRGHCARQLFARLLRQHRAAVRIQAAARGCSQRRRYRRALQGVVAIQVGGRIWAWQRWQRLPPAATVLQQAPASPSQRLAPPLPTCTDGLAAARGPGARGGAPGAAAPGGGVAAGGGGRQAARAGDV